MRKILLSLLLLVGITTTQSQTQSRWFISPSASLAFSKDDVGWAANLAVGRYFGKSNDFRVDLQGSYLFATNGNKYLSISALATLEDRVNLFNSKRIYNNMSIGIGVQRSMLSSDNSNDKSFTDLIIPLKNSIEYHFTDTFSTGIEILYNFNVNALRQRSLFYTGINLGFRF